MKILKKKLIIYLEFINNHLKKSIGENSSTEKTQVNTLAPKVLTLQDDINRVKPYLESLKQAIDTPDINNIALAGGYGSGKSTILKTFQNEYHSYKYLNISLASFKDNKEDEEALERKLEISILQQMFYHVAPSTIPDSRFKRIVNITRKKLLLLTTIFTLWTLSTLLLFKFNYIEKIDPQKWKMAYSFDWITFSASVIFFSGIALFIKSVYRLLSNSKISKLNIKGELELGEAVDKSVFNQHLEEILYFFERTEFNVVIIEDVDRFNSTDIFTKLREINILINNSKLINRSVKFVYAIKDEMFTDKNERVKFFEHIVPVIPFINPSNANEQLAKLIAHAKLQNTLSSDFTSDVVTFIDDIDMRLLTNIFQEYQIYKSILNHALNQDKLFAILVYKNMYPDDFGELSKRRGKLYRFFTGKKNYIASQITQLNLQIQEIDKQIKAIDLEIDRPITELRAVYINRIISKLDQFHCFYQGADVSIPEAVEDSFFKDLINDDTIRYKRYRKNNSYYGGEFIYDETNSGIKLSDIEMEIGSNLTYLQREKLLVDKFNSKIKSLRTEKEKLRSRISEIEAMSIKEIFEHVPIDSYINEFSDSYLMRNLLLNGYIDEHFDDYISLFHGIALTNDDFSFEKKVKSGSSLPFDYTLTHTDNLIKKLPVKYFKKVAILNFSLLDFLIENGHKYSEKLDSLFNLLSGDEDNYLKFIIEFLKRDSKRKGEFAKNIFSKNKALWHYIYRKSELSDEEIGNFVRLLFEHADITAILNLSERDSLKSYLEDLESPFAYFSTFNNLDILNKFISETKLRFKVLDQPNETTMFKFIFEKNHYQITAHNINTIIKGNNIAFNPEELNNAHYTTIKKIGLSQLFNYINYNIEDYISNVLTLLADNTKESKEIIIEILNREDIRIALKERFVKTQEYTIEKIEEIERLEIKQMVLTMNKVVSKWENVFAYYDATQREENEENISPLLDSTIITFLNTSTNYESLSKRNIKSISSRDEDYFKKITALLLNCNDLSMEAYDKLLDSFPYVYNKINYPAFNKERIEKLLDKKTLILTLDNFNGLKRKALSLSTRLLEIYQDELTTKFTEFTLDFNDWLAVFRSQNVTLKNKLTLVESIDDSIIISNPDIANVVCSILPDNELIHLRYEVLEAIFNVYSSVQKRIALLILHLPTLDDEQVQALTEKLGEDYMKLFKKQHKPTFPYSKLNFEFFKKLRERNLILRYKEDIEGKSIKAFAKY